MILSRLTYLALMGIAAAAVAQPKAPQTARPLTFGAELSIIAVPAIVTDKDGKTVAGLLATDFEIEDAGKPVAVQGFQAVTGDAAPTLPEGMGAATTMLASRRQFVFVFDLALSGARNIERARAASLEFLERNVSARDLVSVVASQVNGFKPLVGLTSDRYQIRQAIASLGQGDLARNRDPLGLVFDVNLQDFMENQSTASGTDIPSGRADAAAELRDQGQRILRTQQQAYTAQVTQFLGGLNSLGRALEAIRGRKNLILFSEGFDSSIITGARGQQQASTTASAIAGELWNVDSDAYFGSTTGQNALENLFAALRGSDVVVHSVDIGVLGGDMMALQHQGGNQFTSSFGDSLATFAAGTGGRYIRGANNLGAALKEIADSTRDYYVLAFAPNEDTPGKLRKLKIKVKRPGLRVSHRPAYLMPDPKKPDTARQGLQASEIIAKGISGGSLKVSAYALPYRSTTQGYGVPVVLQVAPESLVDVMKRKDAGLEVFGYLVDSKGAVRDYFKATPGFDAATAGDKIKASGVQILTTFAATEGDFEVRILVRDVVAGRFGSLRLPVTIPALAGATFVSAPMFVDDPFGRVALPTVTQRRPSREIPFRIADRPFTVETDPVFKKGAPLEICLFARPSTGQAPEVTVSFAAADGTIKQAPIDGLKAVRDADGFDRVVFSVKSPGLSVGDYTLQVTALGATQKTAVRVQ
jgi:VWFA-related protein